MNELSPTPRWEEPGEAQEFGKAMTPPSKLMQPMPEAEVASGEASSRSA